MAQELVDAANQMGGKDNISVVFVAGPEFVGIEAEMARARHSITQAHESKRWWRGVLNRLARLIGGSR